MVYNILAIKKFQMDKLFKKTNEFLLEFYAILKELEEKEIESLKPIADPETYGFPEVDYIFEKLWEKESHEYLFGACHQYQSTRNHEFKELTDKGIDIIFFTGNHDMWVSNYFQKELGISVIKKECIVSISGVKLFIGHGDGLGNGDNKYKILKNIFKSKVCNWLFSRIHPNLGLLIGQKWSLSSSKSQNNQNINKLKNNQLINYSKQQQKLNKVDYYIFGHTHSPLEIDIDSEYKYVNLGDWINYNTYAVLYQKSLKLKTFK